MKSLFFLFLLSYSFVKARPIIQMDDLLCGCNYCNTVSRHEPLSIDRHMMRCESWRESMQKTIEEMKKTKKPNFEIPAAELLPKLKKKKQNLHKKPTENVEPKLSIIKDPYKHYEWRYLNEYGWVYSTQNQIDQNKGWIFREDLGWVWRMEDYPSFIYSEKYGWFYCDNYMNRNILYWYDRRYWLLAHDFWWKK